MFNWYANTFRISEENITKAGLRRTKIFAWLMLLIVPIEISSDEWFKDLDGATWGALGGLLILAALIGWIALLLSPLVHRFWARDKYLDEREIEIKRKGMSAGYKVLFGAVVVGLIYSSFTTDFSASENLGVSLFQVDSLGFALLILTFGVQTPTQLSLMRPIEDDEIEPSEGGRDSTLARIAVVIAIMMLFFGPAMVQGFVDGITDEPNGVDAQETFE